jgi:hypothetical protein
MVQAILDEERFLRILGENVIDDVP